MMGVSHTIASNSESRCHTLRTCDLTHVSSRCESHLFATTLTTAGSPYPHLPQVFLAQQEALRGASSELAADYLADGLGADAP